MTTSVAIVLLGVALALYVTGQLLIPRPNRRAAEPQPVPPSRGVESELLRRPLRSRA